MRACLLRSPAPVDTHPLRLEEVADPAPRPGQVLIRVRACGICRTDLHVVEGELPVRKSPLIPGHQVVGVVVECGPDSRFRSGQRVGVAWLHRTCGGCQFCRAGRENLCEQPDFTGWTVDGGYAGAIVADESFVYPLPEGFSDLEAAPLLCAGIIGFRCLRLSGIQPGGRLGLYGFGAAAHVAAQVARYWGVEVYAMTRDQRHRELALELGAVWAGGATAQPPKQLDAAIVFAPAGEIVPAALAALFKGGTLALGGIHMSDIPSLPYRLLYHERVVRSVANNTRQDGLDFLDIAARIPIRSHVQIFPLEQANDALCALKHDAIRGAAVLQIEC
ncbi:MAG: zinc-dependent alcohol dehydrogenase family protein [Acidobacteria bacterium]|nr:zinc-dependent alcohol dehydrogenase family protein [Acidobacteriota bacterium]